MDAGAPLTAAVFGSQGLRQHPVTKHGALPLGSRAIPSCLGFLMIFVYLLQVCTRSSGDTSHMVSLSLQFVFNGKVKPVEWMKLVAMDRSLQVLRVQTFVRASNCPAPCSRRRHYAG